MTSFETLRGLVFVFAFDSQSSVSLWLWELRVASGVLWLLRPYWREMMHSWRVSCKDLSSIRLSDESIWPMLSRRFPWTGAMLIPIIPTNLSESESNLIVFVYTADSLPNFPASSVSSALAPEFGCIPTSLCCVLTSRSVASASR